MSTPVDPLFPKNFKQNIRVEQAAGTFVNHYQLNSHHPAAIQIDNNGETITLEVSTTTIKKTEFPITDLEDADMIWSDVTNADPTFLAGDNKGLSAIRISGTSTGSAIQIGIVQF